jgi:hypothetical protein
MIHVVCKQCCMGSRSESRNVHCQLAWRIAPSHNPPSHLECGEMDPYQSEIIATTMCSLADITALTSDPAAWIALVDVDVDVLCPDVILASSL